MSKKAFKIASAAAVAASAFVAVNPAQAATAAEAEVLVKKAESLGGTLKWAISVEGSWDGHSYPDMKLFNDTKAAHAKAVAAVSTLSGSQKTALEARLNDNVKKFVDRAVTLIDAVSAGMKIEEKKMALELQLDANKIDTDTERAYNELSTEIRKQEVLLSRVYGQSSRASIREYYQHSAEAVKLEALYPVSVLVELNRLDAAITAKNETEATTRYNNITAWLPKVENATMKAELTAKFDAKKSAYEALKSPKVESVSAINGKELVVKFNKAINKDKVAGNVKLVDTVSGTVAWDGFVVSEDAKTITFTATGTIDVKDATLTVEPIELKDDATKTTERFVSLVTFKDTVAPSVTSVKAEGTTAVITFDEPVYSTGTVSLNGVALTNTGGTFDKYELSTDGKTLTVKQLEATKSYKVDLVGAKDFVDNLANPISLNFTVAKPAVDTVKPTVSSNVSGNKLTLNFSKAVTGAGEVTIGSEKIVVDPTSLATGVTLSTDKKTLVIDTQLYKAGSIFGANSFVNASVTVDKFTDGTNVMETVNFSATLLADTKAPTVVSSSAKADGTIVVEFNEEVQVPTVTELVVGAVDGITQSPVKKFAVTKVEHLTVDGVTSKNKLVYTIGTPTAPQIAFETEKTYGVELDKASVKDVYGKSNAEVIKLNVTRPKGNAADPTAVVKTTISESGNVISIQFNEDMTDSAKNSLNYSLAGKVLPSNTTVEFINDRKNVKITLPAGYITANGDYNFTIGNVIASSGNTVNPTVAADNNGKSTVIALDETVAPTVVSKLAVNSSTEVVVSFSEAVASEDLDLDSNLLEGITTKVAGKTVGASYAVTNGKLVVTLTDTVANATDTVSVDFLNAELVDTSALKNKLVNGVASN
jgi:SbsC C-terminal domain